MYQNIIGEKSFFYENEFLKTEASTTLKQPYPSISDMAKTMNSFSRKRNILNESGIKA